MRGGTITVALTTPPHWKIWRREEGLGDLGSDVLADKYNENGGNERTYY